MRRIFCGFCKNRFLTSPLHYLSSRSDFRFEFAEIFVIEKRLSDSPNPRVNRNGSKSSVRDSWGTDFCKKTQENPPHCPSLPCPFKQFTLRFSNKSVQSTSCERPQRTRCLWMLFEYDNCLQARHEKIAGGFWINFGHCFKIVIRQGIATRAEVTTAILTIPVRHLCWRSKYRKYRRWFMKNDGGYSYFFIDYNNDAVFTTSMCKWMWKLRRSPILIPCLNTIIVFK